MKFIDAQGQTQEVSLDVNLYKLAHDENLTVAQYINREFPTNAEKYGSAFEQMCVATNLILHKDRTYGLRAPSIKEVLSGDAEINAGTVIKESNPASRLLFPAVALEMIETQLLGDYESNPQLFDKLVALDDTIAGSKFEQPVLNYNTPNGPMEARSQRISQLALPATMLSITASDISKTIPTFSLGMEIADQAAKITSIDLVTLALSRQVMVERNARAMDYFVAMYSGDTDMGSSGLSAVTSNSLDSNATGGTLTQKAWLKWLNRNSTKRVIDWIMCDIDTYLKIEARTGRPGLTAFDSGLPRLEAHATVRNKLFGDVNCYLVPAAADGGPFPANTVVGLDSRFAIRRVRNSEATYEAVEEFVLKRSKAMRFDFGEIAYRLFDEAWDVLTIS